MATHRAPKQWSLTTDETLNSFENWRQNLMYILSLDHNFAPFLTADFTWQKKSAANPTRGLQNDTHPIPETNRKSAAQKNAQLDLMLGQIASWCPIISRNSIIKSSTSLNHIWQTIRQHYGFQKTGAHFLDLADIKLKAGEKPQDLFQRLMAFFEDNLLPSNGDITHHGTVPEVDEDMSPSLENTIVLMWLRLVNPSLPQIVKQKYGAELRNKTLASLKPEISQALPSLLDEIRSIEDTKVLRIASNHSQYNRRTLPTNQTPRQRQFKSCTLCKAAGRPHNTHFMSSCKFLPDADKRAIGRSRLVLDDDEGDELDNYDDCEYSTHTTCETDDIPSGLIDQPVVHRVNVIQSPFLNVYYNHHPVRLTLDTGATTNMIKASVARDINLPIKPASQMARQADGVTPLDVIGEVHCQLNRDHHTFRLDALVVKQLDVDVLAGNPFHVTNDVATRPAKRQIVINGSEIINYGPQSSTSPSVRRTQAFVLRAPSQHTVILPGEFIQLSTPRDTCDSQWALEPRLDSPSNTGVKPELAWPPVQEVTSVGQAIRLTNTSVEPIVIKRNEHLCQIRPILTTTSMDTSISHVEPVTTPKPHPSRLRPYSSDVSVDPDGCLSQDIRDRFVAVNLKFDHVFNPRISRYNGASGNIQAVVNMGPTLPPQRKGRLPQYRNIS